MDFEGFSYVQTRSDLNAPGGKSQLRLLVVAVDRDQADRLAKHFLPAAAYEATGPDLLAKARAQGIGDGDAALEKTP